CRGVITGIVGLITGGGPWYCDFHFPRFCFGFVLPSQYNRCDKCPGVPICNRSAIQPMVMVVFCLKSIARRTFSGFPFRWALNSVSPQPNARGFDHQMSVFMSSVKAPECDNI